MPAPRKYTLELRERAVAMYRAAEPKPVIRRMAEDLGVHPEALRSWIRQAEAAAAVAPVPARVAGRAVLLIPHRGESPDEAALPGDYRKILQIVRVAGGPVQVKGVGEELGLEVTARGELEPLRAKPTKLADRGWLHKRPDGKFTARL